MFLLPILLALGCRTTQGFSQEEVFFQFAQLSAPAFQDGVKATQDFHHRDENGVTHLKYHVEHREDAVYVHLDSDKDVSSVFCNHTFCEGQQGNISVFFTSEDRARGLVDNALPVFISGGTKWGCLDPNGKVTNLMLHEGAAPVRTFVKDSFGRLGVNFVTEPATFMHFFENADISFRTDKYPQEWFSQHDETKTETEVEREFKFAKSKRTGDTWSMTGALTAAWETVKEVGGLVESAVATVATVAKVIVTGNYQYDSILASKSWAWNYDFTNNKFIKDSVTIDSKMSCQQCAAAATLSIEFQLVIANRKLTTLRLVGEGWAQVLGGANMDITASYQKSYSKVVATIHVPSIKFVIGEVPVVLDSAIPITLGYDVSLTAAGYADFDVDIQGNYSFGVQYTSETGMKFVSDSDFENSAEIYGASLHASFTSVLYILPTLQITVNYIGGPNVGVKLYSEVNIDTAVDYPRPCNRLGGIALSSNVGLQVTIGAELAIKLGSLTLYKKNWEPTGVYSLKKPVLSGCYADSVSSARGEMAARALAKAGEAAGLDFAFPPSKRRRKAREPFLFENFRRLNSTTSNSTTSQNMLSIPDDAPFTKLAPFMSFDLSGKPTGYGNVQQLGCSDGVTWHGVVTRGPGTDPECDQYPPYREFSFQTYHSVVSGTGPDLDLVGSTVDSAPNSRLPYACVRQRGYYARIYSGAGMSVMFGSSPYGMDSDYDFCSGDATGCSCSSTQVGLPSRFYGLTDQTLTTITLEDGLGCTKATLSRIMPGTTGQFYATFDEDFPSLRNDTYNACGMET